MSFNSRSNLANEDIAGANNGETEKLLNGDKDDDDDFFLRGPSKKTVRFASDKINDVKVQIAEVTDAMRDNVGRLLERGDRLDDLNDRSEGLAATSDQFRVSSQRLRRKMWWENLCTNWWIIVIIIGISLIIIIPLIVKYKS